jgi:GH43 family beta-xylosidase
MLLKNCIAWFWLLSGLACNSKPSSTVSAAVEDSTFTNPLLPRGPDPWVIQKDSVYYYTHTQANRIAIYKTGKMSELGKASPVTIWTPPATGLWSKDIWAPEIHYLQGKWYVYFAADDGINDNHRIYVLENASADPLSGNWEFKGKMADTSADTWAIDASVFEYNGQLYCIWSGWEADINDKQNIYIAKMQNPWTIAGKRSMISTPTYSWEIIGAPPAVNEGPEALRNNQGNLLITYSASGCWTDSYSLGLLRLKTGGDPMNAGDWSKNTNPVFITNSGNQAFSPGHNGFFKSRDGKEDWIIYHANAAAGLGCKDARSPRMQSFGWNADGSPDFGQPAKIDMKIKKPSGE